MEKINNEILTVDETAQPLRIQLSSVHEPAQRGEMPGAISIRIVHFARRL